MTLRQPAETRRPTRGFHPPTDSGMEIIKLTRGSVRIHARGRTMTLSGEAMASGAPVHSYAFYADLASIRQWENGMPVTDVERGEIIRDLPEVARSKGWMLVIH